MFDEIRQVLGDEKARRVFATWAKPPSRARLKLHANMALIDRLDRMPGGPNIKELARQIARENNNNDPTPQQIETEERQIQRLNNIRRKNLYWPQRRG